MRKSVHTSVCPSLNVCVATAVSLVRAAARLPADTGLFVTTTSVALNELGISTVSPDHGAVSNILRRDWAAAPAIQFSGSLPDRRRSIRWSAAALPEASGQGDVDA